MAKRRRHSCRKGLWTTGSLHKVVRRLLSLSPKRLSTPIGWRQELRHACLTLFFQHYDRRLRGADRGIVLHHVGSTPPLSALENALAKAVIILKTRLNAMQELVRDNSGDKSECSFWNGHESFRWPGLSQPIRF